VLPVKGLSELEARNYSGFGLAVENWSSANKSAAVATLLPDPAPATGTRRAAGTKRVAAVARPTLESIALRQLPIVMGE
jgi:hypothetical protein